MTSSIEKRLRSIEASLGITDGRKLNGKDAGKKNDRGISDRVDSLLSSTHNLLDKSSPHGHANVASDIQTCHKMARELAPAGLLLATASIDSVNASSGVFVYRRQEILARFEELQDALETMARIKDMLLVSNPSLAKELQKKNSSSGERISLDHIVSAPILASPSYTFASNPTNVERLEALADDVIDVNDRSTALVEKVDGMVDRYYTAINEINETLKNSMI